MLLFWHLVFTLFVKVTKNWKTDLNWEHQTGKTWKLNTKTIGDNNGKLTCRLTLDSSDLKVD